MLTGEPPGEREGLPPVTCGGFYFQEPFPETPLGATDTITLDLAVIPFPQGSTQIFLSGTNSCWIPLLDFHDGQVNSGLAYRRVGWNDVQVTLRVATHDYDLTVNGVQDTFAISPGTLGGCQAISGIDISAPFSGEGIAWLDSLDLSLTTEAGSGSLIQNPFSFCGAGVWSTYVGGALVVEPPRRSRQR